MNKQAIDEVARWIYDDHGIPLWLSREIVDKVAELLTSHEGERLLYFREGWDDGGTERRFYPVYGKEEQ